MTWTPHFGEHEFLRSATAARLGLTIEWEHPAYRDNALRLTHRVLEPLRARVLRPVHITSGYRTLAVTHALRAANYSASLTSDHMTGCAVDVVVRGMTHEEVATHLYNLVDEGVIDTYDQLIWYEPGTSGSCHVSLRPSNNRRMSRVATTRGLKLWQPTPVPLDDTLVDELTGMSGGLVGGLLGASVLP